jgi:hypothetical protein
MYIEFIFIDFPHYGLWAYWLLDWAGGGYTKHFTLK